MDNPKKPCQGPPFIGPPGDCNIPPDFPNFCPPPQRPTPPCMPPVPTVVQGDSLLQAMNNLSARVNTCIGTYNDVIANCYQTLRNLELAAQENGSYYGPCEVWVEDGYYPATGSAYKLIHKAPVDRRGNPIRVQLALAYGNTTNSRITQSAFSASKTLFADKLFTAVPVNQETGWTGNAMWNGAPIPHGDNPTGYTMGFNRAGVLRVYTNSVSDDQMQRDEIVDAMGCMGILVQNGQVVDDSYLEQIPGYDVNAARITVGQNMNSREVIFLVCGAENNVNKNGLTSKAAAEILQNYGADIAVEITNQAAACALDKGGLMFEPTGGKAVDTYAFWYITRACYYKGDYERELAELTQNYHTLAWQTFLNEDNYEKIQEQIAAETTRATAAEAELDAAIKAETERAKAAEAALSGSAGEVSSQLTAEIARAKAAEAALQQDITAETTRATTAEAALREGLTTETADRKAADETLSNRISAEELARQNADHTLQQSILTESNDRAEADQRLENLISAETTRAQAEEKKLADSIAAETARATTAEGTLTTNLNAEITRAQGVENTLATAIQDETAARTAAITQINTQIDAINNQVSSINQTITTINASISRLNTLYDNLTQQVTTMDAALASMQTTVNQIEVTVNELKQTVAEMQQLVDDAVKKLIQDIEAGTVTLPYVKLSGDTMTGPLTLFGPPTEENHAATKGYVDEHEPDLTQFVKKSGDTMTGPLILSGDPTEPLQAATMQYVNEHEPDLSAYVRKAGDTMTGILQAPLGITDLPAPTQKIGNALRVENWNFMRYRLTNSSGTYTILDSENGNFKVIKIKLSKDAQDFLKTYNCYLVNFSINRYTANENLHHASFALSLLNTIPLDLYVTVPNFSLSEKSYFSTEIIRITQTAYN